MADLYNRISVLCQQRGVSVGKMCAELGISRGNLTELKMGRIKSLKSENLTKISGYFGVSVDYLLGAERSEAAVATSDLGMDDFTYALQNEAKGLTDADKEILLSMARQLKKAREDADGQVR